MKLVERGANVGTNIVATATAFLAMNERERALFMTGLRGPKPGHCTDPDCGGKEAHENMDADVRLFLGAVLAKFSEEA